MPRTYCQPSDVPSLKSMPVQYVMHESVVEAYNVACTLKHCTGGHVWQVGYNCQAFCLIAQPGDVYAAKYQVDPEHALFPEYASSE